MVLGVIIVLVFFVVVGDMKLVKNSIFNNEK